MRLLGYKKCNSCSKIYKSASTKVELTPCCKTVGSTIWPNLDTLILLEIVETNDTGDFKKQKIAVVFTCTIFESLLEGVLWSLLKRKGNSDSKSNSLLNSHVGRRQRIKLFDKEFGSRMEVMMKNFGFTTVMQDWNQLANLRNEVVHVGYHHKSNEDPDVLIKRLLSEGIESIVRIHNEVHK